MEWLDKLRERFGIERMTETIEQDRQREEALHQVQQGLQDVDITARGVLGERQAAQQRPSREYLNRLRQGQRHEYQQERGYSHGW